MRLLIDTNVFLWTAFEPARLSRRALEALAEVSNELLVSAVTPFELGVAAAKGRIALGRPVREFYTEPVRELEGAAELAFTSEHALRAAELPYTMRDLMDRMLAAQALVGRLPLVTSDRRIAELGIEVIW